MTPLRLTAGALVVAALLAAGFVERNHGPSIEGNYVLDYRELPDGKKVRGPDIIGMMTFTKDHRNFNVYWTENGKAVSIATIWHYTLSDKEFSEELVYYMINDAAGGKGITYETTPSSGKSPVTFDHDKDKVQFKFPLHNEPECVFDKHGLTATRAGAFLWIIGRRSTDGGWRAAAP